MLIPLLKLESNRVRRNYLGGKILDQLSGETNPSDGDRPEDWIASTTIARNPGLPSLDNEGLSMVTLEGSSVSIRDLYHGNPVYYLGVKHVATKGADPGFLMKLLDSSMRLHIQAHPTAEFAQTHLNSRYGKLETYLILDVREGCDGHLLLGFQRAPSPQEWFRIVTEQDMQAMHQCFDPVPVNPGEVWLVPGGMPHAIGEGVLVMEVMEPSDLVVRCEFEREGIVVPPDARFMGCDPAFALTIFDYTSRSVDMVHQQCQIAPMVRSQGPGWQFENLITSAHTDCFTIDRLSVMQSITHQKEDVLQVGLVTQGDGVLDVDGVTIDVQVGDRFLVPAATRELTISPSKEGLVMAICQPLP